MKGLWSDQTKFSHWLLVELAVLKARTQLGRLGPEVVQVYEQHAGFSVARINELEAESVHDLLAFVGNVQETIVAAGYPQYAGHFHDKITSYDTEDPALMIQLRTSAKFILAALQQFRGALYDLAQEHKWTLMIARTHGQLAEPDTFGRLLLDFVAACDNDIRRLSAIIDDELSYAKLSGAVGNYAGLDPELETATLAELGLHPVPVATQIVSRDRHATYINELAVIGGTLERLAITLHTMTHGLIGEVREPRGRKQKGSSIMPHKRNPIKLEQFKGMARMLRGWALDLMASIATPECRAIDQSCVERVVYADATSIVCYMLEKFAAIIRGLEVFPKVMEENLEKSYDTWASPQLKSALLDAGVQPIPAYEAIQAACFTAVDTRTPLRWVVKTAKIPDFRDGSVTIMELIGQERVVELMNPRAYIEAGVDVIFARFAA